MADKEFEEFTDCLDDLPQHFKASDQSYKLVHAITPLEENKSFLEKVQFGEKLCGIRQEASLLNLWRSSQTSTSTGQTSITSQGNCDKEAEEEDESDLTSDDDDLVSVASAASRSIRWSDTNPKPPRRPKSRLMPSFTKKSLEFHTCPSEAVPKLILGQKALIPKSLHQELKEAKESLSLCLDSKEETDDVDVCDVDSGNSTNHSPVEDKCSLVTTSFSGDINSASMTSSIPLSPYNNSGSQIELGKPLELLEPTHRGLHRFVPRHPDEIEVDIGDPVYVQKEAEDLWCEGANLRSGEIGIFPIAHVVDVEYNDFDPDNTRRDDKKERYLLDYIGSVETSLYKGNIVLCQAVRKISLQQPLCQPICTVLEISDKGIKMLDKSETSSSGHDYFFNLKNITFCGFHPREPRYFGFVTKHPEKIKYACHVFIGQRSTQPVAEACGRAFQRFYRKFMETAYPVEDIYLE